MILFLATNAGEDGNAAEDGDDIGLSSVDDIEQIRAEYTPPPPPPCMDPLYQPNDDGTLPGFYFSLSLGFPILQNQMLSVSLVDSYFNPSYL